MSEKIIHLTDLIDHRLRKEIELQYYKDQLIELQEKIMTLQKDVDLTRLIIEIVQADKVIDIKEKVEAAIPRLGVNDNGSSRPE